jgi:hypothetical protein
MKTATILGLGAVITTLAGAFSTTVSAAAADREAQAHVRAHADRMSFAAAHRGGRVMTFDGWGR